MNNTITASKATRRILKPLKAGFVPLTDCAPLVMAKELGLYAKYGLSVQLSREVGWATVRDKIIYEELDAAHALAPMPFAATFGLGSIPCDCVAGLVLNLHGNAITLSQDLWTRGVRDARTFRHELELSRDKKTYTLGVVFPSSSHNFLLRKWLKEGGIDPDRDVRIVVVPAPSMFSNLQSGNLDGYCVGEPWNSMAVQHGIGWCPASSAELSPRHPEKVLMVRRSFAEEHEEEHLALIAALIEACQFCDLPENRELVAATLAKRSYLNVPAETIRASLMGKFEFGHERVKDAPEFHVFSNPDANEPGTEKASWIMQNLLDSGLIKDRAILRLEQAWNIFLPEVFHRAQELIFPSQSHECETAANHNEPVLQHH